MISYTLAHVGINCANAEQARKGAALFEAMFGLTMKEGNKLLSDYGRRYHCL